MTRGLFNLVINYFVANIPFACVRRFFYCIVFQIGKNVNILMGVRFLARNLKIGENSVINYGSLIDSRGSYVEIGSNVDISPFVHIWTMEHDPQSVDHSTKAAPVIIEDNVWIGSRATILPGVVIGKGAVVAAGSIVVKNVNPLEIVAGVPAKVIGRRELKPQFVLNYSPWFF